MGIEAHHIIAITSLDKDLILEAHAKALTIFPVEQVTNVRVAKVNDWKTFFIGPDGSKEGWTESTIGNKQRKAFKDWMETFKDEDGSNSLHYHETYYGDYNKEATVVLFAKIEWYKKLRQKINLLLDGELKLEDYSEQVNRKIGGLEELLYEVGVDEETIG